MLNYIWGGMMLISIVFGAFNGTLQNVASSIMSGATDGVNISHFLVLCAYSQA